MGKGGKSATGTLVERSNRNVVLVPLPDGRTAPHVRAALTRQLARLPEELRRTLTWDQGQAMADHGLGKKPAEVFCRSVASTG